MAENKGKEQREPAAEVVKTRVPFFARVLEGRLVVKTGIKAGEAAAKQQP